MLGVPLVRVLACAFLTLAAGLLFACTRSGIIAFYTFSGLFKRCRKRRAPLRGRRNDVSLL